MRAGPFGDPDRFTGHEIHQGARDVAGHRTTPAKQSGLHLTNDEQRQGPLILDDRANLAACRQRFDWNPRIGVWQHPE
ncbi:hypothetical protein GCM10010172_74020 [Paractinoplanes ferrugineus]|uniref:Uncharacterized protein n=1 Tax=Paractinoplanes ferrugineus TaxID=113564 RepID=A0A919J0W4_9ACTN|nr:hypothetical protein Afe05nite_32820 [Actinoplanes ferrugineus]